MLKFSDWTARRAVRCTAASAMVLAASAAFAPSSPVYAADASDPAILKYMNFRAEGSNSTIRVISTDGKKWNAIKPSTLQFWGAMSIKARYRGRIRSVAVVLGQCAGSNCPPNTLTYFKDVGLVKEWSGQRTMSILTNKIPLTTETGIATLPDGNEILAMCNENIVHGGPFQEFKFTHHFTASFLARSRRNPALEVSGVGPDSPGGMVTTAHHGISDTFPIQVICEPAERETAEDVEDVNMVTKNIELKVVAPASPTTKPNPSTSCRKGKLTVRMEANRVGPVKYRLWSRAGDAPMTSKVIDMWASEVAPGNKFVAEHSEWVTVTKTSTVQAMAEDMINPIGQTTGWKEALVRCEPTNGGFADAPRPGADDPEVKPLELTGELTLADQAGVPKDKPRTAQAVFKIWASRPGSTSYRLTCSGGRQWEGTLPTYKVADKKYQAVGAHNIQITKTEQIGCALRSTSKSGDPVLAIATKLFKVIRENPNVGASGITGKPRPQTGSAPNTRPAVIVTPKPPKRPKKPAIKVAPKPRLVCLNGKVRRGKCFCPSRTKKKRTARNAYRCEQAIVKPNRVIPKAPPKRIVPSVRPKRVVPTAAPKRTTPKTVTPATRRLKRQTR